MSYNLFDDRLLKRITQIITLCVRVAVTTLWAVDLQVKQLHLHMRHVSGNFIYLAQAENGLIYKFLDLKHHSFTDIMIING